MTSGRAGTTWGLPGSGTRPSAAGGPGSGFPGPGGGSTSGCGKTSGGISTRGSRRTPPRSSARPGGTGSRPSSASGTSRLVPERIGNLDGIPVAARDAANRKNLPALIEKLEGVDTDKARKQLAGLREIDRQLKENGQPPMYLIGIGDEGNGRAIVSFGNPDASQNVSAYVPGLNTSLDEEFAKNDLGRARDTAIGAQGYDESTASIVWLGYDAPSCRTATGWPGTSP